MSILSYFTKNHETKKQMIHRLCLTQEQEEIAVMNNMRPSRLNMILNITPKNLRILNWLIILALALVVAYMFRLKNHVQDLNSELKQITSQIKHEQDQYSVLKAELAYLESPARLQKLAAEYLKLDQVKPTQVVMEGKKTGNLSAVKFIALSKKNTSARWRYKNGRSNLQTVNASYKANK